MIAELVTYTPDRSVAVLRYQQRAVVRDRNPDGPAPDLAVVDDKAGDEILVFAGRRTVLEADADYLVTGPLRAVPGAVLGRERIAAIFRREIVTFVESEPQRSRMRLDQHIRDGDLVLQAGLRTGMT